MYLGFTCNEYAEEEAGYTSCISEAQGIQGKVQRTCPWVLTMAGWFHISHRYIEQKITMEGRGTHI